jgi:hypothetical protein
MTGAWNAATGKTSLAARMAGLALRAQRLLVLSRLDQLEAMVRSQLPELRRVPGGSDRGTEAHAQLQRARRLLEDSRVR